MRYDRDVRDEPARASPRARPSAARGGYGHPYERRGIPYEAPYRARPHGYAMGWAGGALRSRGSFEAGQIRSGLNPYDEFEFEWGEGYVGGRGYGGTNYDYEHGYRTDAARWPTGRGAPAPLHGPARYGYGPYHDRLRRRRRDDGEIREDVEEALFYDTWVDADAIAVDVDEGVVTLRGTLPSYDEVRYATDDAWDVDGVRGVRSALRVERRSTMERLESRREFSAGEIARENEAERSPAPALAAGRASAAERGGIG
ncbi:MAG: BON domain-containing protein, partial [Gemmatimonadota bacterium]